MTDAFDTISDNYDPVNDEGLSYFGIKCIADAALNSARTKLRLNNAFISESNSGKINKIAELILELNLLQFHCYGGTHLFMLIYL